MALFDDVMAVENGEGTELDQHKSLQRMINAGSWSFQGSMGRTMMQAIEDGRCLLGKERAKDYYGNVIPSRNDVVAGTKGSYSFVANRMGKQWANAMKGV